jgi:hypothetical protein
MRRFYTALLLFLVTLTLSAQWDIVDEVFIPPNYYVGDSVLYQFRLVWDDEKELTPPEELPSLEWLEFDSVTVEQEGYEAQVTIRFRSYMTGTRSLPILDLGEIQVDSLKIFTSSLVEQEDIKELRGIRDNLDFPGIKFLLPLFLILLISSPYVLFLLVKYLIGRIWLLVKLIFSSGPRRKIQRLMTKLDKRIDDNGREKDFYIDLSSGIRTYLTERTGTDYLSMTTRDMKKLRKSPVDRVLWIELTELLMTADLVKFAGEKISRKHKVHCLSVLKSFIENLEKEENDADL